MAERPCAGHQGKVVFDKALEHGCAVIQPITEVPEMGVSNAVISDPFGYIWMLQQINREVSFEERTKIWDERLKNK